MPNFASHNPVVYMPTFPSHNPVVYISNFASHSPVVFMPNFASHNPVVYMPNFPSRNPVVRGAFNKFPNFFFVQAFKIVVDSWTFSMLLLLVLWDDWPIFMISASKKRLQQELKYTLLKPDCHSWWISKMLSGREDTLEERHAIKFCFKLGKKCHKNAWNASDCFSTILYESSISFWVA